MVFHLSEFSPKLSSVKTQACKSSTFLCILKLNVLFYLLICLISSQHLFQLFLTDSFLFLILSLSGFVASCVFTFDSHFEVRISTVPATSTTWFNVISLRLFSSLILLSVPQFSWFGEGSSTMSTCSSSLFWESKVSKLLEVVWTLFCYFV